MPYKYDDVAKKLKKLGFMLVRQKGSHVIFLFKDRTIVVPKHNNKEISVWVEKCILRLLEISAEDFKKL